ncbi:MAG: DNA polymerase I [Rhodothermaceae bacterium]|nr:DNA polymerase I [Rhodothermaceae bacterium]
MPDQPSLFDTPTDAPVAPSPSEDAPPWEAEPTAPTEANSDSRERLYLCDALALAYRAHFAFISRPLINTQGLNTSAAYGFVSSLLKLLEDEQPEHIAVVFDAVGPGGTFRDELYAEYKAHRPPMPEGLRDSLPFIKRLVEAFDIPVLEEPGVEADDVIGTLAKRAEDEEVDVIIVSPDKDFRQLLSEHVSMFRPAYKGEAFDRETPDTFREKYGGLEPIQFIDLLALMGDSADNVPGVPGIGEKTAVKLIDAYGSVEQLIEHADELTGKRAREGMTAHADDARLSKKLVTIMTDVPLDVDWHTLRRTDPDLDAVNALFDELEFGKRLRTRIERYAKGETKRPKGFTTLPEDDPSLDFDFGPYEPVTAMDEDAVDYTTALAKTDLPKALALVEGREAFSVDTETTSVDQMMASLVGVSLAGQTQQAAYVPTPLPDGTQTDTVLDALRAPLEDAAVHKIGHNLKYDLVVLARHGVRLRGPIFDTMVAHYLVDPEESHKLDDVAGFYLNYRPQPISDLIGTGKNALSMRDVPIEKVGPYACEDADVALRLVPILREKLEEDGLLAIAEEIEFPLIPVLADMEMAGVKVNPSILEEISTDLGTDLGRLQAEIYKTAGTEFNIASPKQLGEILFSPSSAGGLGLTPIEKTKSGAPSTNERVLHELATEHPLPAQVIDWRKLAKLKSTYVDKLPELIHPETGRIHTDFNQTVTATGRLSSSNPNLQNIPIRTEQGREIRRAFVAEESCQLLAADYAQIELRIIAHMSRDAGLVEAFQEGLDIHTATAARVFDVPLGEVTRPMRDRVKQINYGIPYGISAFGIAQRMRMGIKDAQQLIDQYRMAYPDVLRFLDELMEQAREDGYVETLLGRRRYVPQIKSRNPRDRALAERIAVNMPVQGTQADMIKRAMIAIHSRIGRDRLESRMILQVHDELVFEVPEAEVETMTALVREEMMQALPLDVPIVVDVGVADNWLDAH